MKVETLVKCMWPPASRGRHRQPRLERAIRPGHYRQLAAAAVCAALALAASPGTAAAHGPVAPAASKYLARVTSTPPGLDPKVIDGDQRLWLRAPATITVVVLDYRGAPYLRFSASGVEVNQESSMYYLNATPAQTPPPYLGRSTRPRWRPVTSAHDYNWHDGRLHALASVALSPGATYVGRWTIPMLVNGHPATVAGGLWYAPDPSLAWFWPIVVALGCVLAARRLRRPSLNQRLARALAITALISTAVAGASRELHGRPVVGVGQELVLAGIFVFVAWALTRILPRRNGNFLLFVIALAALWAGGSLVLALVDGFVLLALPAFISRAAVALCLASGAALFVIVLALIERPEVSSPRSGRSPVELPDEQVPA